MGNSDKSLTLYPHDIYIQKYTEIIDYHIETSQPLAIIGAYGLGKGIITDYLRSLSGDKYKIAYLDLHIFIELTEGKLFAGIINSIKNNQQKKYSINELTEDEFYWRLTAELDKMKQEKMVIVLRHAGRLLSIRGIVLDRLNDFMYDNKSRMTLVVTADPRVINFPSESLDALLNSNYIYYERLDKETARNDIYVQGKIFKTDFSKYEDDILEYSHDVHGTIAFLCLMISKYKPKKLTNSFIYEYVYTNPKLRIFFNTCFDSLTDEQTDIIHRYCLFHRLSKADKESAAFKKLLEFNVFYKLGKSYEFIYEMFSGFIVRLLSDRKIKVPNFNEGPSFTNNYAQLLFKVNQSKLFTSEELSLLRLLIDKGGEIASYAEVAKSIWNDDKKYSVYAINKIVSRTRIKAASQQNLKCAIVTKYKFGYYLIC